MTNVFISYSIEDRKLHLITLLLKHLRKNNFHVSVSTQWLDSNLEIANSDVFIGIITNNSNSVDYVVKEWQIAKENKLPNILIIEDGVKVDESANIQYIRFNRSNPQEAIDQLFKIQQTRFSFPKKNNNDVSSSKVLIGIAIIAGIAALLSLLSKNE